MCILISVTSKFENNKTSIYVILVLPVYLSVLYLCSKYFCIYIIYYVPVYYNYLYLYSG